VYLFQRRSGLQFCGGVPKDALIRWTVVDSPTCLVHHRYHVGGIFSDELEELLPIRESSSNALELYVLIERVDVKEKYNTG
jgi:hypothetical protein